MNHTGVRPVKITYHYDPPDPNVRRVVGYESECGCGWVGSTRKTYAHARDDLQRHKRESHPAG